MELCLISLPSCSPAADKALGFDFFHCWAPLCLQFPPGTGVLDDALEH